MVSIIIPAFNTENFIDECLLSVRNQTYGNFEALVIDDGSTDGTAEIVRRFEQWDSRFRLLSVDNGGVSKARNIGISAARGRWLTFLDADDMLHPTALKAMTETAEEEKAEVVITAFGHVPFNKISRRWKGQKETYRYEEAMKTALYQKRLLNNAWGMLIGKDFLGDRRFREGIRYEDLDAFYRFYEGASKIIFLPYPFYFYRENPKSFINTWSETRLDVLGVTDKMIEFFKSEYPSLADAAEDRRFSAHYNMLLLMKKHRVENPEAMERCRSVILQGRERALRDPEVRLKNKLGALLSYLFI